MVLNSLGQFACRQHYFQLTQHSEWIAFLPDWMVIHYASLKICFACIAEHYQEWFFKSTFEWSPNTRGQRGQRSSQRSDDHDHVFSFSPISSQTISLLENVKIFCSVTVVNVSCYITGLQMEAMKHFFFLVCSKMVNGNNHWKFELKNKEIYNIWGEGIPFGQVSYC